jgi:hypothetical protein
MRKILGIIAIVGIGALIYGQYKKAQKAKVKVK